MYIKVTKNMSKKFLNSHGIINIKMVDFYFSDGRIYNSFLVAPYYEYQNAVNKYFGEIEEIIIDDSFVKWIIWVDIKSGIEYATKNIYK